MELQPRCPVEVQEGQGRLQGWQQHAILCLGKQRVNAYAFCLAAVKSAWAPRMLEYTGPR